MSMGKHLLLMLKQRTAHILLHGNPSLLSSVGHVMLHVSRYTSAHIEHVYESTSIDWFGHYLVQADVSVCMQVCWHQCPVLNRASCTLKPLTKNLSMNGL